MGVDRAIYGQSIEFAYALRYCFANPYLEWLYPVGLTPPKSFCYFSFDQALWTVNRSMAILKFFSLEG